MGLENGDPKRIKKERGLKAALLPPPFANQAGVMPGACV
jgi:hypothetical protein